MPVGSQAVPAGPIRDQRRAARPGRVRRSRRSSSRRLQAVAGRRAAAPRPRRRPVHRRPIELVEPRLEDRDEVAEPRPRSGRRWSRRSRSPSPTSPRARRVMSRQPVAASAAAAGPALARRLPGGPATASTSAAARTSGRWEIAATAASCRSRSIRVGRAPCSARGTRPARRGIVGRPGHDDPRPAHEQVRLLRRA